MEINKFSEHGRTIMVKFDCARCGKAAYRPLDDCLPSDYAVRNLSDLKPPPDWRNGGFYYPTFCPECAEKYDQFMMGKEAEE